MTVHDPEFDSKTARSPHPEDRGLTPRTPLRAPVDAVRAADMNGGAYVGRWIAVYRDHRSAPSFTALVDHVDLCGNHVHVYSVLPAGAAREGEEELCWTVQRNHLVTSLDDTDLVPLATWELHWFVPAQGETLRSGLEQGTSPYMAPTRWNGLAVIR